MPPRKQKQTAFADASISSNDNIPSFPAPPSMVLTNSGEEETNTPKRSPAKPGAMGITEAQKQALMDNLQLESKNHGKTLVTLCAHFADGYNSHRTRAEAPGAVRAAGARPPREVGNARQSHPSSLAKTQYSGPLRGTCR